MNLDEFTTIEQLAAALKSLDMVTAVPWTDYSGTSTIVGWTTYTNKYIHYMKDGIKVFVRFHITGTSDDAATSFTLPFTHINDGANLNLIIRIMDDGTYANDGHIILNSNSNLVTAERAAGSPNWTASGDKRIYGEFWYISA